MVEPTFAGRLALLRLTADLNQRSWGWPLWIVSLIGIVPAMKEPQSRRDINPTIEIYARQSRS